MFTFLRLRNFKCFRSQDLELRPLTLLTGLNGMGKSSVLQAFLLLRQSHERGLLEKGFLALNDYLVSLGTARDILFDGAGGQERMHFEFRAEGGFSWRWEYDYQSEADVLANEIGWLDEEFLRSSLFTNDFHYLEAERTGPRVSFPKSDYLVKGRGRLGTRGEFTAHFLVVHGEEPIPIPELTHQRAMSMGLLHQVEAWMGEVSPGVRIHVASHRDLDVTSLQYSFARGGWASERFRCTNVGFGLTYTLPILVAVLASRPGGLVLIENPEAHLHPRGQARFGELLARAAAAGVQLIVETHSDHLVNGVRVAVHDGIVEPERVKVLFFDRAPDDEDNLARVRDLRIDRDGRIDEWPDGFGDEWDKALERLLEPRED
jgi:predicted ATPase